MGLPLGLSLGLHALGVVGVIFLAQSSVSQAPVAEGAPSIISVALRIEGGMQVAPEDPLPIPHAESAPQAESPQVAQTHALGEAEAPQAAGVGNDYLARLRVWLLPHRRYPRRAREMRLEGVAHVRFTLDAEGRLVSCRLVESSGHALLDDEAVQLIRRAAPMPPPTAAPLDIILPVQFAL